MMLETHTPLISIIVPIHNVEKYINQCLDSILVQTYSNFELLLIDDGTPDKSGEICEKYALKDSRIRVFHKENGGVSSARNFGLDKAKGDWISFIDSDDYISDDYLENLLHGACLNNADIAVSGVTTIFSKEKIVTTNTYGRDFCYNNKAEIGKLFIELEQLKLSNYVWNKLYKYDLVSKYKSHFDVNMPIGEDLLFNLDAFMQAQVVCMVNNCGYYYVRRDEGSAVSKYYSNLQNTNKLVIDKYNHFFNIFPFTDSYVSCYMDKLKYCLAMSEIPNLYRKNTNLDFKKKTKEFKRLLKIVEDIDILHINKLKNQGNIVGKIFLIMRKYKSANLLNIAYSILFIFRYNLGFVYFKIRHKLR